MPVRTQAGVQSSHLSPPGQQVCKRLFTEAKQQPKLHRTRGVESPEISALIGSPTQGWFGVDERSKLPLDWKVKHVGGRRKQ